MKRLVILVLLWGGALGVAGGSPALPNESPDIPHDNNKFVKGLAGRDVQIIRKSGSWEDWLHDSAVVTGGGRHYILVALTKHLSGDEYLAALAQRVDDLMQSAP